MPNIIEQRVTNSSIFVRATNGNTFNLTKAEIQAHAATETGTAAQRKAKTITWVLNQMQAALGADMVDITKVTVDVDLTLDSVPIILEEIS